MTNAELIATFRAEIERLNNKMDDRDPLAPNQKAGYLFALADVLSFLDTLESEKPALADPEEPEEESDLQDAEVIFSGYALHTDVTKWADGYKLKIRIYDDN